MDILQFLAKLAEINAGPVVIFGSGFGIIE
jgi:hypothetical protein